MSPRYLRHRPSRAEEGQAALVSLALAAGVGLVTFYLTRLLIAREPMGVDPDTPLDPIQPDR